MSCASRLALIGSALFTLTGCLGGGVPLGEHPLDEEPLDDAAAFAHVDEALGVEVQSVGELLSLPPDQLTFDEAPDPSGLLASSHDAHQALPALSESRSLRVLVQNVGLLDRQYLAGVTRVPETGLRRAHFARILLDGGWDVMLLTEVWELDDVETLREQAGEEGWVLFAGSDRLHEQTGLVIAVREALIVGGEETDEGQFADQYALEEFPGPNLKRGWLRWSFDVEDAGRVHLIVAHLTAFADQWAARTAQARELGLYVQEVAADEELVLLGGDFNAAPYYPRDVWVDGEGEEHPGWLANTLMYPALLHYGGLTDAHNAYQRSDVVRLFDEGRVPLDAGEAMLDEPLGDEARCPELVPGMFTAIDCNSLHFESYAGTEYPARLDYLFLRDDAARARVADARIVNHELIDMDGEAVELSDHYGVGFTLDVAAP